MNQKHRKTLEAIFAEPIRRNIAWSGVVALVQALGGEVRQGDGSKVRLISTVFRLIFTLPILKRS